MKLNNSGEYEFRKSTPDDFRRKLEHNHLCAQATWLVEGSDMTKICALLVAGGLALAGCEGGNGLAKPTVPEGKFPSTGNGLPVLLTGKNLGKFEPDEGKIAGTLVRRGPCLHLGFNPDEAVIVWEEGTTISAADERGLTIVLPSGLRIAEGDVLRGRSGNLPSNRPIAAFTNEAVPDECATGAAVQIDSVEVVKTVRKVDLSGREPPPPPPPPAPSFLDTVKNHDPSGGTVEGVIRGVDDPREAVFIHLLSEIRGEQGHRNAPVCLREVDDRLFASLSQRFDQLYRAGECRWSDGGVVIRRSEKGAVFVSANLDCNGKDRCVAEGARVYGNVGGEGQGYDLRPVEGGWEISTMGVSWMS